MSSNPYQYDQVKVRSNFARMIILYKTLLFGWGEEI